MEFSYVGRWFMLQELLCYGVILTLKKKSGNGEKCIDSITVDLKSAKKKYLGSKTRECLSMQLSDVNVP